LPFHDGSVHPLGYTIYWSGEDPVEQVIKPRFDAAGGDVERCLIIEAVSRDAAGNTIPRAFDPATDMASLLAHTAKLPVEQHPSIIVLDPIISVTQGDGNTATEVRRDLKPLQELAEKLNCVVIGITHFNKHS
jgi:RecA-family ATPase